MGSTSDTHGRGIAPAGLVAGILMVAGILLAATADMRWLILAGAGAFGPGIARELGWLHDQDEFQRQAAWRAGYHAYLAGGFVAVVTIALLQAGQTEIAGPALAAALVLAVLWLAWLFSSLLDYAGARRAAGRTLLAFGVFWACFVVLGNIRQPAQMAIEGLIVLPFFVLAWTCSRWPRLSGALLLLSGGALTVLLGFTRMEGLDTERLLVRSLTFTVFAVPLLASGLALVRTHDEDGVESAVTR